MPASLPTDFQGKPLTLPAIERALAYQMDERLMFAPPPDPYIADLFFDWGNIVSVLKSDSTSRHPASHYYEAATLFGHPPRAGARRDKTR